MSLLAELGRRLTALLGGGGEDDPEAMVTVATVAPYRIPAMEAFLNQRGIPTGRGETTTSVPTWTETTVLQVRRTDLDEATAALAEFNRGPD